MQVIRTAGYMAGVPDLDPMRSAMSATVEHDNCTDIAGNPLTPPCHVISIACDGVPVAKLTPTSGWYYQSQCPEWARAECDRAFGID